MGKHDKPTKKEKAPKAQEAPKKEEAVKEEASKAKKDSKAKMKPAVKALVIIVVLLFAVAGIATGIVFALNPPSVYNIFKGAEVYRNITIDDISLDGLTQSEALKKLEAYEEKLRDEFKLEVVCDGETILITKNVLKIDFNTKEVIEKIPTLKGGESLELTATIALNELPFQSLLNEFAKNIYVAPIEPNVTNFDYETLKFSVSAETNRTTFVLRELILLA